MQLITGYTGSPHVSAQDDSVRNCMLGEFEGKGVFPILQQFEATAITANEVRVYSGYGINQGRLFKIDRNDYDVATIENGSVGTKRVDLITARYERDETTGIESMSLNVIKGSAGSTYEDPTYISGRLLSGDLIDDMPLYRVKIQGITIEAVEPMFTTYESLIGGAEAIIQKISEDLFDDKLADNQQRFDTMIAENDAEFETWLAQVEAYLDEDTAMKLTNAVTLLNGQYEGNTTSGGIVTDLGYLPIANGGTGATTAAGVRSNIGLGSASTAKTNLGFGDLALQNTVTASTQVSGILPIANGGTGNSSGYIQTGLYSGQTAGTGSTVEGVNNFAYSAYGHVEGGSCYIGTNSSYAHAEGYLCNAEATYTHAQNYGTVAKGIAQTTMGKFNVEDLSNLYALIVGNGTMSNNRSNAMTLDWSGNLKATSYANLSSRKYKENIEAMSEEDAKKLLDLKVVKYDYIDKRRGENQYGLIAEDVVEVFPYPVISENGEVESIDYSRFVPSLIKMVQMQQQEIEKLKEDLNNK